ncbi:MAG: diacylglycerol kinase family lipid kinase [Chloroflexi bacterium]|jgi:diacylglycerol kinase (ATP)|nr:diacylglycerol kinase family lipid kinase [Chloroflexota bacterium]
MTLMLLDRLRARLRGTPRPVAHIGPVFVVLNPEAGRFEQVELREALRVKFRGAHSRYTIYEMNGQEDIVPVVRQAIENGFSRVVAAGGDGTVSAVVSGLVGTNVPLGIIPIGTGNALARELGIPLKPYKAVDLLVGAHTTRSIDAMQVGERYFVLVVGAGVSSLVIGGTHREAKLRFGRLAYVFQVLKQFLGFQPYRFKIVVDGRTLHLRASEVLVANTSRVGWSALHWARNIRPDDGELVVCIIRLPSLWAYLRVGWSMLFNRQHRNPRMRFLGARDKVLIECRQPVQVQADGEMIGQVPVEVRVVPSAVQVIVPPVVL